jgi:D-aminoacyl-tRNA deacylase
MICVIQRVSRASVTVDGAVVGQIDRGLMVLAAVHRTDTSADIVWTARKLAELRVFPTDKGNFDLDAAQVGGAILLVSNFTVAAETRKGRRPSLDAAAEPAVGREKFDELVAAVRGLGVTVETGRFGEDMKVELVNDGPVTFLLDSRGAAL